MIGFSSWGRLISVLNLLTISSDAFVVGITEKNETLKQQQKEENWLQNYAERVSAAEKQGKTLKEIETPLAKDVVVGKVGINYELNGTEPYLTCAYYNKTECDPAVRPDCRKTINCYLDGIHRQLGCIGVFESPDVEEVNTTEQYLKVENKYVEMLGCLILVGDIESDFCSLDQCRAKTTRVISARESEDGSGSKPNDRRFGSCCCHTKNCNGNGLEMVNPYYETNETNAFLIDEMNADKAANAKNQISSTFHPKDSQWSVITQLIFKFVIIILCGSFILIGFVGIWALKRRFMPVKMNNDPVRKAIIRLGLDRTTLDNGSNRDYEMNLTSFHQNNQENSVESSKLPVTDLVLITHGRFGHVYRGKLLNPDGSKSNQIVAVKKHSLSERPSYTAEKAIFDEFIKLEKWYPSILYCYGSEQVGKELCIVTEFHQRLSLYEVIKRHTISQSSAVRIILTMLDGLQFLHDERPFYFGNVKPIIIHRDIKSKNVLIKDDMTACIADFGLARKFDFNLRRNNDLLGQVGTKRYMSPEVLEGATEFTPSAFKQMDVYAMALVIWEVLSRVQLSHDDIVPEFKLPYEDDVGVNPQIGLMRSIVVTRKIRPQWRDKIDKFSRTRVLKSIAEEMWDPEGSGRITAGCAFDRTWRMIVEHQEDRNNQGPEASTWIHDAMVVYHEDPYNVPHPTPDPFLDYPLPPPFPSIGEQGIDENEDEADGDRDSGRTAQLRTETIFDLDMGRLITREEADEKARMLRDLSRESTPTPETSY